MSVSESGSGAMRARLGGNLRENGMVLALLAIVLFFLVMVRATQGVDFLSAQNITNLFLQNSYVIIMALGMLLVIVSGHIDLSVGSVAAFTGAVSAVLTVKWGWPVWAVIPATLVMGGIIPQDDIPVLKEMGVKRVFTPSNFDLIDIMESFADVIENVPAQA